MDAVVLGKVNQLQKNLFKQYVPLAKVIISSPVTSFTPIIDITGKGYIDKLLVFRDCGADATNRGGYLKVTIDNVLTIATNFFSYNGDSNYCGFSGFVTKGYFIYSNGYLFDIINSFDRVASSGERHVIKFKEGLPYIENEDPHKTREYSSMLYLPIQPLFFKQSFKVELKNYDSDSIAYNFIDCIGGLEIWQ